VFGSLFSQKEGVFPNQDQETLADEKRKQRIKDKGEKAISKLIFFARLTLTT